METKIAEFELHRERDVALSAQRARLLASLAGLPSRQRIGFGKAVGEVAREVVACGGGSVEFCVREQKGRQCIEAVLHGSAAIGASAQVGPPAEAPQGAAAARTKDGTPTCVVSSDPKSGTTIRLSQPLPAAVPLGDEVLADWATILSSKSTEDALITSFQRVLELNSELSLAQRQGVQLRQELENLRSLSESQTLLTLVASKTDSAVMILDQDHVIQWVNDGFLRLTGCESSEVIGRRPDEVLYGPQTDPLTVREIEEAFRSGRAVIRELLHYRKDGRTYWASGNLTPVFDEEGRLTHCIGIYTDVTKRHQTHEALEQAKEAAEAASMAKSEFLANMSHEIRTPMNAIMGMTELTLCTELTDDQREYLTTVKKSAESLLSLLNDILDLSKIEAGKMELDWIDFNLADLLRDTLKALAVRAGRKGLELAWHLPSTVPERLIGDPARLRQVLVNLVDNAIKFTRQGEVVVRVEPEWQTETEAALRFAVCDTGIGIPADRLQFIFEAFRQADSSTTRRFGGTGLGLTISSQLIELMGGQIWVKSESGKGSTFRFSARFGLQPPAMPSARPSQGAHLAGKSVLIVDDNATNRRILKEYVQTWGMKPTVVDDARAALRELAKAVAAGRSYQLVLSDALMPEMDGFELARQIAQQPGQTVPNVMMLSSADRPGDVAQCRDLGVAAYLTKPIAPSDLREAILRAMGHAPATSRSVRPSPSADKAARPLRVLVADDHLANRVLAAKIMQRRGHLVQAVSSGQHVLEALQRETFDIMLLDVQMPEMDGFEVTEAIREKEKQTGGHLPIIAMTAYAMTGDRDRCLAAGMDAYLAKPIRADELESLVESLGGATPGGASPDGSAAGAATEPVEAAADERFDFSLALERLRGDEELLKEQMRFFLSDASDLLNDIRTKIANADARALEFAAHRLKGLVSNFDAAEARQCAMQLERMGRDVDLALAEPTYRRLEGHVARLQQALEEFLSRQ